MSIHSCLSREYSYLVFKDFPIEFHAEFKEGTFRSGSSDLTVFNSYSICDTNKLFAAI